MSSIGLRRSLVFYFILILIMLVSMYFSSTAFIAYFLIIAAVYILKNKDSDFRWGVSWKFGYLFGFILISLIFIIEFGLGWIKFEKLYPDTFYILIASVAFELLVSLGEELSFRGYILPNLIDSFGTKKAVITTSVLFAGLHIPSIYTLDIQPFNGLIMFITVGMAGLILALLYIIGGLKNSCGFHFSWNFFQYHVFSLRSGFGIFGLSAAKPAFTGGEAGPEAGIIGLFVLLLGASVLLVLFPALRKE